MFGYDVNKVGSQVDIKRQCMRDPGKIRYVWKPVTTRKIRAHFSHYLNFFEKCDIAPTCRRNLCSYYGYQKYS